MYFAPVEDQRNGDADFVPQFQDLRGILDGRTNVAGSRALANRQ